MKSRVVAIPNIALAETGYRIDWADGGNTRLVMPNYFDRGQRVQKFNRAIRDGTAKGELRWMEFCVMLDTDEVLRDFEGSALYKRASKPL